MKQREGSVQEVDDKKALWTSLERERQRRDRDWWRRDELRAARVHEKEKKDVRERVRVVDTRKKSVYIFCVSPQAVSQRTEAGFYLGGDCFIQKQNKCLMTAC